MEKHSPKKCWKFSIRELTFILVVFLTEIGCNISLDTPGALQNAIIKNYELSSSQFALFYTLYFIPSILLNSFSGFLIDRVMGIRLSTLVYSIIGIVGVALFAVGGVVRLFWLMLVGRLIFGLGNELSTGVCVNYCIFSWYRNTIMNLVCSISSDGSFLGSLIVYQAGPRLLDLLKTSLPERNALDIIISLTSGLFLVTSALAILMTYLSPKEDHSYSTTQLTEPSNSLQEETRVITLSDVLHFPATFWFLCLLNCCAMTLNSFPAFSQGMLTSDQYNLSVSEASNLYSVLAGVKIALSIPLSMSVDLLGRNTIYVFVATILGALSFFLLTIKANPYACMVLMGVYNSIFFAAISPMYGYPLDKHFTGSCYGIMSTVGSLTLSASPLIVGLLIDKYGYAAAMYFYFAGSASSVVCIIIIWILDKRSTGILNMTPQQRIEFEHNSKNSKSDTRLA